MRGSGSGNPTQIVGAIHELPLFIARKLMMEDINSPSRRSSMRLPTFNYSQPGYYFVTLSTRKKTPFLGKIVNTDMVLDELGNVVSKVWRSIPERYRLIELDSFVVMPNHVHGIINILARDVGAIHELPLHGIQESGENHSRAQRRRMLLPLVIGYFKMMNSKKVNELRGKPGEKVWQRNYYDTSSATRNPSIT